MEDVEGSVLPKIPGYPHSRFSTGSMIFMISKIYKTYMIILIFQQISSVGKQQESADNKGLHAGALCLFCGFYQPL